MFLFLRLFLGHLIGDFSLQTDGVYKKKIEGMPGHILHACIVGAVLALFSWPYLGYPLMWGLIFLVSASHILFDWLKIKFINKVLNLFWAFLLDQALHIGSLLPVFLFDFVRQPPQTANPLVLLYNNNKLIILLSGYLFSGFFGTYLLDSFKKSFFPKASDKEIPRSLNYFLVERMLITAAFCFLKVYFLPLALFLFFGRIVFKKRAGFSDFLLNLAFAGGVGVAMKLLARII